jgi:hypothetical protein
MKANGVGVSAEEMKLLDQATALNSDCAHEFAEVAAGINECGKCGARFGPGFAALIDPVLDRLMGLPPK